MSKKLLLADDSITIQKVIGITFAQEDYSLTIVDNGDAALIKARADRPDLILADVVMPGKNGYELCAALRQDPQLRNIPVLLLTGTFEPFDEGKAKAAGADSWIAKPFESQALLDRVEDLLSRAEAPAAAEVAAASPLVPIAPAFPGAPENGAVEEESWPEPEAADDFWGAVSAEAAEEFEAADDDWSGVAAEVESAVSEREDASGSHFDLEEDSFAEISSTVGEDSFHRYEELELSDDSSRFAVAPVGEGSATPLPAIGSESDPSGMTPDWAGFEEEILPLDDCDIIEEEDLEWDALPQADLGAGQRFPMADHEGMPAAAALPRQFEELSLDDAAGESKGAENSGEFLFEEEAFPIEEELPPIDEPEWELAGEGLSCPEDRAEVEDRYPPFPTGDLAPAASLVSGADAKSAATAIEERIAALSDEEIGRIVERVAGSVIERLAHSLLEKVAWEVVPDLAEGMIREEIRKIREVAVR